jgi:hypothetical protein
MKGVTMTTKPKVGVHVMALLEDDYNKTAHMRPLAQKAADRIGIVSHAFEGMVDHMVDFLSLRQDIEPEYWPVAAPQMLYKLKSMGIQDWCNFWCLAGAPHHQALAMGYLSSKIKTVAAMLNLDVVEV